MFTNPIKRVIMKYAFSGHESFQCKGLWLKKGYDYVKAGLSFTDDYAVVELGVGKNMVASIRYWLRAFGITNGFFVKFGGNLFFISTVFFFLNPIKSCRYVCFLVTLKTPHH